MKSRKIIGMFLVLVMSVFFVPSALAADTAETTANLVIKDPGFDNELLDKNGYFQGWENYAGSPSLVKNTDAGYTASPDGSNYLATPLTAGAVSTVRHYVNVDSNTDNRYYIFSAWYKAMLPETENEKLSAGEKTAQVLLNVKDKDNVNYEYVYLPLHATGGEWTKASAVIFVPDDAKYVIIQLMSVKPSKCDDNSTIFWDGISLEPITDSAVNFLGNAGNMEETKNVTVDGNSVEVPAHIKVFTGYDRTVNVSKTGALGKNYKTVTLSAAETYNGRQGKAFKMEKTDGDTAAEAGLSAILNFQAAAGYAVDNTFDVPKYILSGYFKTEGTGFASVREQTNVVVPNTSGGNDDKTNYERDTGKLYTTGGKWEKFEIPVHANKSGHAVQLEYVGTGSVIWDDLTLSPYDSMETRGFEAVYSIDSEGHRKPAGFVDSVISSTAEAVLSPYSLDTASHNGAYALSAAAGSELALSDLPLQAQETYKLSFWAKLPEEGATGMKASMQIGETAYTCTFPKASAAWGHYVAYFTAPEGAETGSVILSADSADAAFFLDDVSFAKAELQAFTGAYTKDGKDAAALSGNSITFHGHSIESGTAVTAVYKTENNVKTLCTLSLSDGSKKVENGWTVPAYMTNTVTHPSDGDISVKSFFIDSVLSLKPFGSYFKISKED